MVTKTNVLDNEAASNLFNSELLSQNYQSHLIKFGSIIEQSYF